MILPGLKSASLISIGQLCDDNCDVFLNKHTLLEVKDEEVILEGTRNQADGLWDITVQKTSITNNFNLLPKHPGLYKSRPRETMASRIQIKSPTPTMNRIENTSSFPSTNR